MGPSTGLFDVGGQRLVTPPIRGRINELNKIGALVTAVAQGRGGVLVIEGPPGIGKSRLLTEVLALAEKAGVRALFGEAFEYQQTVPFFSLFMATLRAEPPVGDAEALRRLGTSADLRYWVVHDLAGAIHTAAVQTPLAILLEDVHWADNATLLALRSLAAVLPGAPVLWVLTARTGAGAPAVQETLSVLQRAGAVVMQVGAMTADAVADMVQDAVRAKADVSLLNLAAKAHGNPFLVSELLGGLGEEGRLKVSGGRVLATGDALPRRLGSTMHQRLDLLSGDASEVVRVAAVLPDRFSARLLAAMLERQPASLLSALEEAVRADLLVEDDVRLRFRHDLLREATRQSLPQSLRRAMERQAASVMLSMGAAPAEVATQLARSAEPGDREAIDALRQATQAVGRGDASAAADLSKRALDLLPAHDGSYGSLVADTVEWLNRATRYDEAQALADRALATQLSQDDEAEIRLQVAAGTEDPEQRIAELRRALQLVGINDVTRARHQAWVAYFEVVNGLYTDASAAGVAAAAATATGDLEARIVSDTALALIDYQDGYAVRALQRMDEVEAMTRSGEATFGGIYAAKRRVGLIVCTGSLADASAQVAEGTEKAHRERNAMALPGWTHLGGMVHVAAGRLVAARGTIEALPRREWANSTEVNIERMLVLAEVAARTGDRMLLQDLVSEALVLYPSTSPLLSCGAAYVVALAAWHRGDVHDAVRWLGRQNTRVITPLWPNVFDQVILMSRVASVAGDAGLRARVLQSVEVLERERPGVALFAAVARQARGILDGDADALLEAANALETWRPLLYAGAAEDAADELARAGRDAEAIESLNQAFDTFAESEALADARRVGRALRRLGVERRIVTHTRARTGWDSLTDSELTVINLIAQGATNRSVAQQLHLSPHTVKTHVHNAFAKLGITSRAELAQLMRGSD
ncbi:LuxR family transcriptional regulator [Mycobacterium sp. 1245499.0]|uniref:ATP-binding protein n=1 Tax=unclassified Mycobacterium TaxID=2642494 RepID=UPI000800258F|nr:MULTISPECIES: LuxR family transcriptional regulator [unclassified Mycobacterium]OBJ09100.1 LuxR family transcriptional regulator [Mycobacterium sp. 1482292.6]OBL02283.1 LuxR family transcriptional regulator [Mycobacterium sp. 1245499.0]